MRVARVTFPHDMLPDVAYAKVVKAIEREADTLEQGVAVLDDPTPFVERDEDADPDGYRIELIDGGEFETPQDPEG